MGHLPEITGRALSTDRPLTLGVLAAHEKLTTQPLSNPLQLQNIDVQLMTAPRTSRAYCLPALSHLFQTQPRRFVKLSLIFSAELGPCISSTAPNQHFQNLWYRTCFGFYCILFNKYSYDPDCGPGFVLSAVQIPAHLNVTRIPLISI